ncbi:hypothetical protein M0804_008828 [Polistes exclamans]|nr:hypothetical protein M0804_008828 [Polistes exclamans]
MLWALRENTSDWLCQLVSVGLYKSNAHLQYQRPFSFLPHLETPMKPNVERATTTKQLPPPRVFPPPPPSILPPLLLLCSDSGLVRSGLVWSGLVFCCCYYRSYCCCC